MTRNPCTLLGLLFCMLLCLGCDRSPEIEISGKVTLDGQPIERGTIRFVAEDGTGPSAETTITDGAYSLRVLPGKQQVSILGYKKVGEYRPQGPESPLLDKLEQVVPPQYNEQTTLAQEISRSTTSPLNFDLKSK